MRHRPVSQTKDSQQEAWLTSHLAQFINAVSEIALGAVLAGAFLCVKLAEPGLVEFLLCHLLAFLDLLLQLLVRLELRDLDLESCHFCFELFISGVGNRLLFHVLFLVLPAELRVICLVAVATSLAVLVERYAKHLQ